MSKEPGPMSSCAIQKSRVTFRKVAAPALLFITFNKLSHKAQWDAQQNTIYHKVKVALRSSFQQMIQMVNEVICWQFPVIKEGSLAGFAPPANLQFWTKLTSKYGQSSSLYF
jgi:hypothetical protein